MRQEVKHIFDSSACLTKRQLRDYVNGSMSSEESHALEHHINSCFFCSEAIEGITDHKEALASVEGLNTTFLKDHFSITHPHVHLNSMALAAPGVSRKHKSQARVQPLLRPSGFAAFLLLALAIMWYLQSGKQTMASSPATRSSVAAPASQSGSNNNNESPTPGPGDNTVAASIAGASSTSSETPSTSVQPQVSQSLVLADAKPEPAPAPEIRKETMPASGPRATAPKKQEAPKVEQIEKIPVHQPGATESSDKPSGIARLLNSIAGEGNDASDTKTESEKGESSKSPEKEMSNSEKAHQEATLSAAKAQINQGEKEKAAKLLETVISEGSGSQKRQAKRLLRDLNKDTE